MLSTIPKVSIVILHFDDLNLLTECLRSCQNIRYPNYEIIIIKNGNGSNLALSATQELADSVTKIIYLQENVGYARGNNYGIQEALEHGAHYVLLLNDDTTISPDFLEALVEIGEKLPANGMLGPAIYYFDEPNRIWFAGARFDQENCMVITTGFDQMSLQGDSQPIESGYITGCALMVKKPVIEAIGLLDERFFLYWEDVDWGLRAKNAGYSNLVVPNSHIWHKVSVSAGGPESPLKAYHKTRSHLLMAKLHAPWALPRLQRAFLRDIAYLLFKSSDENRMRKAWAYLAATKDYYLGKTDKGPHWLWQQV
jgi:GT2 family glycosyltransferase